MPGLVRRPSSALLAFSAIGLCAHAPCGAETLLSLYTGTSVTRDSALRLVQPGTGTDLVLRDVRWAAEPFKPAPYYGLRLTRFDDRHPQWGVALDVTHYKMVARTARTVTADGRWQGTSVAGPAPMQQYVQQFGITHGVNVLSLNVLHRWAGPSASEGTLRPYVGVGLAHYRPHAETTVAGTPFESGYVASGFGAQVLAGVQVPLTPRTGLFVEAKFNRGTLEVPIAAGRAETPVRTAHVVAGISFAF